MWKEIEKHHVIILISLSRTAKHHGRGLLINQVLIAQLAELLSLWAEGPELSVTTKSLDLTCQASSQFVSWTLKCQQPQSAEFFCWSCNIKYNDWLFWQCFKVQLNCVLAKVRLFPKSSACEIWILFSVTFLWHDTVTIFHVLWL